MLTLHEYQYVTRPDFLLFNTFALIYIIPSWYILLGCRSLLNLQGRKETDPQNNSVFNCNILQFS